MKIEASEKLKVETAKFVKLINDTDISEDLKKEIIKRAVNLINISSKESFIKGGEHIINKLKSQKKGLKNEN
ncbi:hypothetical protein [Fusobacterium polymorphum]|uniref:hypothetical protein n=1 Tax=Fusobacterium nucleatum subsp. polymorphum TaxID=76857 RepID=UPI003008CCAE